MNEYSGPTHFSLNGSGTISYRNKTEYSDREYVSALLHVTYIFGKFYSWERNIIRK